MQHRRAVLINTQTSELTHNDSCGSTKIKLKNPTAFRFQHIQTNVREGKMWVHVGKSSFKSALLLKSTTKRHKVTKPLDLVVVKCFKVQREFAFGNVTWQKFVL